MMKRIRILKSILIGFRIILILSAIFLVVFLIYQDLVPSGTLAVKNTIKKRSALFSEFYPAARIREKECNEKNECWQTMFSDPLYFDIIIPRNFPTAKIIISYQGPAEKPLQIGLRERNKEWSFQLKTLEIKKNNQEIDMDREGWLVGEADFSVPQNYIIDRSLKFMLSAPEIDANRQEIKIKEIDVILQRDPMTARNFLSWFKSYLVKLLTRGGID